MTLRRRLMLAFLLGSFGPALLIGLVYSVIYLESAHRDLQSHTATTTRNAARGLDEFMHGATRDMRAMLSAGLRFNTQGDWSPQLQAYSQAYAYFREVFFVGRDGRVAASSSQALVGRKIAEAHEELARDLPQILTLQPASLYVSDFDDVAPSVRNAHGAARAAALELQLVGPVPDARGEVVGVLVAVVTNQAIAAALENLKRSVPGAQSVALLNAHGQVLMSTANDLRQLEAHPYARQIDARLKAGAASTAHFRAASGGTPRQVTVAQTLGPGGLHRPLSWRLVVVQGVDVMGGPVYRALALGFGVLGVLFLVGTLGASWLVRRFSRPVEAITAGVQRVGEGHYGVRLDTRSDDEIGTLAEGFNRMAEQLQRHADEAAALHEQLRARNAELAGHTVALEARQRELTDLEELMSVLQAAEDIDDAAKAVPRLLGRLLAPHCGAAYVAKPALGQYDRLGGFGDGCECAPTLAPADCWALRLGRPHAASDPTHEVFCAHIRPGRSPRGYVCVPMQARGVSVGLLHVMIADGAGQGGAAAAREHIRRVAEQMAMGLASLTLREALTRERAALALANDTLERRVGERTAELARTADALAVALRVKNEFLANVTHELRTPLNLIIGFAELLEAQTAGPLNPQQAEFAATVLAGGHRLLALVNGIIELTQIESGAISLEPEEVDLEVALEDAVAAQRSAAAERAIRASVRVSPDVQFARLDPHVLQRVLEALVANAIKFNRDGGSVLVSAARSDGRLEISVTDTGIGIAREQLPKAFEPFVQLDASITRRFGGIGLGLTLVRALARVMGGEVGAESEPGRGSRFWVRLPLQPRAADAWLHEPADDRGRRDDVGHDAARAA